jgi:hypothetical protein
MNLFYYFRQTIYSEKAKPLKGGDAKLRVYSRKAMIAELPTVILDKAFGCGDSQRLFSWGLKRIGGRM